AAGLSRRLAHLLGHERGQLGGARAHVLGDLTEEGAPRRQPLLAPGAKGAGRSIDAELDVAVVVSRNLAHALAGARVDGDQDIARAHDSTASPSTAASFLGRCARPD